eukprot:15444571-Alexandrium_andersonii.AAC.1
MLHVLGSRVPVAEDCAACGVEDCAACGVEDFEFASSRLRTPSIPTFVGRFGIFANGYARVHPSEASGIKFETAP